MAKAPLRDRLAVPVINFVMLTDDERQAIDLAQRDAAKGRDCSPSTVRVLLAVIERLTNGGR